MKTKLPLLLFLVFTSCKLDKKLYSTYYLNKEKTPQTLVVVINEKEQALITVLNRSSGHLNQTQYVLNKVGKNKYINGRVNMELELKKNHASLQWRGEAIDIVNIKRSEKNSSKSRIEALLLHNYIVHVNEHQKTRFDLRNDSIAYQIKNKDTIPYKQEKWFLTEIDGECFISYYSNNLNIDRIEIKNGVLTQTICNAGKHFEFKTMLEPKQAFD